MKSKLIAASFAWAVIMYSATPSEADIIYDVNLTVGTGSVTGFIETDGTLGALSSSEFVNWSLLLINGSYTYTLQPVDGVIVNGAAVTATTTGLFFDFSESTGAYLVFGTSLVLKIHWGP
jgi:hypothetical protein